MGINIGNTSSAGYFIGGDEIVRDGLQLHLDPGDLDSYPGGGTTVYDLSGIGNHATLRGSATVTDGYMDLTSTANVTDFVTIYDNALDGFGDFTIEMWLYMHTANSSLDAFLQTGSGNDFLWYFDGPYTQLKFANTASTTITYNTSATTPFLFSATRSGSTITVYKNNVQVDTITNGTAINVASGWGIVLGQELDNNNADTSGFNSAQKFLGKYGPVRFYNKSLAADERIQNFNVNRGRFGI